MASSIGSFAQRVKQQLDQFLPTRQIDAQAKALGHHWRKGKLGPGQTVHLLLLQLLAHNNALNAEVNPIAWVR